MKLVIRSLFVLALILAVSVSVEAQSKIAFIDSQAIIDNLPEAKDAKRKLEVLSTEWQNEIKRKRETLDRLFRDYQAKEVLYTDEIKQQKQKDIVALEKEISDYQNLKFGAEGDYFKKQTELMRPVQDRLYNALKAVAGDEGYDFVFDRASDTLLLYAKEDHNLTAKVLERLTSSLPRGTETTTAPPR